MTLKERGLPGMRFKRYEIEKKIYSSEHSNIYKALDILTGKTVAIKEFVTCEEWENSAADSDLKRFRREYEFLNMVESRYVVTALDYIERNGTSYIVLEYVNGVSLDKVLENNALSLKQKLQLAIEISEAISVLNDLNMVHRDIKPENIMVDLQSMTVTIIDLGIGKFVDSGNTKLTKTDFVLGTCMYMSPEQSFSDISIRSDVFSLGVTLYQMFFDVPESPFMGGSITDIFVRILIEDLPKPLFSYLPQNKQIVYEGIFRVVQGALEKFPHRRWDNSKLMSEAFRILLNNIHNITDEHLLLLSPKTQSFSIEKLPKTDREMFDILLEYGKFFYRQYDFDLSQKAFQQILKVFPEYSLAKQYQKKICDLDKNKSTTDMMF